MVSIVVLFPLVACGQFSTVSAPTLLAQTQTPFPTYTPYPTNTPFPTYTPFVPSVPTTLTIDEFRKTFIIYFPGNYVLSKRDETYSGGSPAAYEFVQVGEFIKPEHPYFQSQPPYFDRIQFHTLESLQAFYEWCDQQALLAMGVRCFQNGDPDLINKYHGQKEAFENRDNYEDYVL